MASGTENSPDAAAYGDPGKPAAESATALERFWDAVTLASTTAARQHADAVDTARAAINALSRGFDDALREFESALRQSSSTEEARAAEDALLEARKEQTHAYEKGQSEIRDTLSASVAEADEENDRQLVAAWATLAQDVGRALVAAGEAASSPADVRDIRAQMHSLAYVAAVAHGSALLG